MKVNKHLLVVMAVIALLCAAGSALPDDETSNTDRLVRRAQLMMRQAIEQKDEAEQEKTALAEQLAKLKTENQSLKESNRKLGKTYNTVAEENTASKKDLDACKAESDARDHELQTLHAEYSQATTDLATAQHALAKSQDTVSQFNSDLKDTKSKLGTAEQSTRVCEDKNLKLYQYSLQLVARYRHKGFFDVLLQKEPVTQLKQVEIDNIVQDYKTKIEQQRDTHTAN